MTYIICWTFRHEEEDETEDQWNDTTDDAQEKDINSRSNRIHKQDSNGNHQLEVTSKTTTNLLLGDLSRVHRCCHAKRSSRNTKYKPPNKHHRKVLRPYDKSPSKCEWNNQSQHCPFPSKPVSHETNRDTYKGSSECDESSHPRKLFSRHGKIVIIPSPKIGCIFDELCFRRRSPTKNCTRC